jgi:hypothetical protein
MAAFDGSNISLCAGISDNSAGLPQAIASIGGKSNISHLLADI